MNAAFVSFMYNKRNLNCKSLFTTYLGLQSLYGFGYSRAYFCLCFGSSLSVSPVYDTSLSPVIPFYISICPSSTFVLLSAAQPSSLPAAHLQSGLCVCSFALPPLPSKPAFCLTVFPLPWKPPSFVSFHFFSPTHSSTLLIISAISPSLFLFFQSSASISSSKHHFLQSLFLSAQH